LNRFFHAAVAIGALGSMSVVMSAARAQGVDAAAFYSQGVHAYFAGQSAQAEANLNTALSVDPDDPRAYYFRALSLLRQGRRDEAKSDMQIGAALEAQQPNRFAVGAALQRVQGGDRLLLEQYRRDGQLAELRSRVERDQARYGQIRTRESEVTYQKATIPLGGLLQSNGARPAVVYEPRSAPRLQAASPARFAPAAAGPAGAAGDPFADDATATPAGAGPANLPLLGPAGPAGASPTAPSKAEADDNPFGAPASGRAAPRTQPAPPATRTLPADDNPFGNTPSASPTPRTQPTRPATPALPAGDNPFGDPAPAARPQQSPPAAATPTPPAAGGSTTSPADDNPFRSP
jgi:hypothetical protein